jgi:cholesterol transport system auxiliary component
MNRSMSCAAAIMLGTLLSACSVLPRPQSVQLLDPRPESPRTMDESAPWSLSVRRPETDPARDSANVFVRTTDGRLQVHPVARWVAPAPDLMQTTLVRYLRDAQALEAVDAAIGGERELAIDLRRFELAESAGGELELAIAMDVRLLAAGNARVVARRVFRRETPLSEDGAGRIVDAAESALSGLLRELAAWLAARPPPE